MSAVTSASVPSIIAQPIHNQFTLQAHDSKTSVTLNLDRRGPLIQGSDTEAPSLDYQGVEGTLSFSGQQIVTETTTLGRMFTVTLNIVPDLRSLSFTLLLPLVTHAADTPAQAFETIAIKSEHHLSLGGSPTTAGSNTSYAVLKMHGTARKVAVPA